MKIIAILDNLIGAGGGFDQALNAIVQMQRLGVGRFDFEVFTTQSENIGFLERLSIKSLKIKLSILDRFFVKFARNSFWIFLQLRLSLISPIERKLMLHDCDIVYFVTPSNLCSALQKLNYIGTLWDLCHRETPEFPEVRNFNNFFIREENYKYNLSSALVILTDSVLLSKMAAKFYGVDCERFIAMPYAPSPFICNKHAINILDFSEKYKLEKDYFYYPAQFWPHKNHIRILQALKILRERHSWTPNVVFTGKDYGNLSHIKAYIRENQLESQVRILGFVPSEDMRRLYENATAVVMPTYFGPTNLPPLEAWSLGVPLIYSVQLAEQAGKAALLVNPDSALDLVDAMMQCLDLKVRDQLVVAGHERLEAIAHERKVAEQKLCMVLDRFAIRKQCWE